MTRITPHNDRRSAMTLRAASDSRSTSPGPRRRRAGSTPEDHHAPLELAPIDIGWARYASSRMRDFKRAM